MREHFVFPWKKRRPCRSKHWGNSKQKKNHSRLLMSDRSGKPTE